MSPVQDPDESNEPADAGDGPTLNDCEILIARIDGTLAALTRERMLLERRVRALSTARLREEPRRAG